MQDKCQQYFSMFPDRASAVRYAIDANKAHGRRLSWNELIEDVKGAINDVLR